MAVPIGLPRYTASWNRTCLIPSTRSKRRLIRTPPYTTPISAPASSSMGAAAASIIPAVSTVSPRSRARGVATSSQRARSARSGHSSRNSLVGRIAVAATDPCRSRTIRTSGSSARLSPTRAGLAGLSSTLPLASVTVRMSSCSRRSTAASTAAARSGWPLRSALLRKKRSAVNRTTWWTVRNSLR